MSSGHNSSHAAGPRIAHRPWKPRNITQHHDHQLAASGASVKVPLGMSNKAGNSRQHQDSTQGPSQVCCRVLQHLPRPADGSNADGSNAGLPDQVTAGLERNDSMAASEGLSLQGGHVLNHSSCELLIIYINLTRMHAHTPNKSAEH